MGRAARWLWNLVGGSKVKKKEQDHCSSYGGEEPAEKKRWSFWKSRESGATEVSLGGNAATAAAIEAAWFKSFHSVSERKQSKHSIAVSEAATAVATEAAAVAVQAAAVAMRLSVRQRGSGVERRAAVKIQSAFRGYLARKARRALKSLVKLQALIRGYLVRKQAASALHRMQSLLRAQATVRAHRARNLLFRDEIFRLIEVRPRRSFERCPDTKSEQLHAVQSQIRYFERSSPKIIEIDTCRPKTRAPSSPIPTPISFPDRRHFPENDDWWIADGVKCRALATSRCVRGSSRSGAATPARSLSGACSPNYMADTHSFKAKSRSSSSSSQTKHSADARRRQPLDELNGGRLQFLAQDALNSKRASEREVYLRRVW
ncbi:protein IQ-domain 26-like [Zingiber officinale]|uniref:DUF4005 domain-containing protein n=1 Tax=Zingiber officinale TaxID=94328 RepID=A0A8J5KEZ1_ZINOF|nr:protein IQ-domain 26-like [Zingiber officinale]KAG6487262.1 hypothetical protein ZIOFF_055847 [Zingiber officinale]